MALNLKRVYDPAAPADGFRVLVDRVWPRGLTKEKARVDLWLKEVAPTTPLRKWFAHDPAKWPEFQRRYHKELAANPQAVGELRAVMKQHKTLTLVYGAKDTEHNQAVALRAFLLHHKT